MDLYEQIKLAYPELGNDDFAPFTGCISLKDDSDGKGAYIAKWSYDKPIPAHLKLGK